MDRKYWFNEIISKVKNKYKLIAIYGTGKHTELLLEIFPKDLKNNIVGLIDRNNEIVGKKIYGFKVFNLEDIKLKGIECIIISSDTYQNNIYERISYLKEEGIDVLKIYRDIPTIDNVTTVNAIDKYKCKKLNEEEYELWNKFVDESPQGCIFNKTWWFEAVDCQFEIYACFDKNEQIIGGMILPDRDDGITMPRLTQTLGILIKPINDGKYVSKISKEKDIIQTLVNIIPKDKKYSINFNYNFTNWLPFMWLGYNQYCRYTYVIEELINLDIVKGEFRYNIKYDINKANKKQLVVKDDLSIEQFYNINMQTFRRQGIAEPYSLEFLKKFDSIVKAHNSGKAFFVVDSENTIYAVSYIVYDKKSAYYLLGGASDQEKSSGAVSLALWEAIKFSSKVSTRFDFEGSCNKNIEEFFRGFGGKQKIYFNIWRDKE